MQFIELCIQTSEKGWLFVALLLILSQYEVLLALLLVSRQLQLLLFTVVDLDV